MKMQEEEVWGLWRNTPSPPPADRYVCEGDEEVAALGGWWGEGGATLGEWWGVGAVKERS